LDFDLTEEQRLLQKTVREFAETELGPHAREWDERQEFPRQVFTKLGEMGLMGVVWPPEYGGSGLTTLDYAIVMEELARVEAGVALSVAAHNSLCSGHIFLAGSEEQKKRFLVPLARGEKIGCWGLTENSAGSDAGGTKTTAARDGVHWVLNGSKTFITNGRLADTAVVMAVTDRAKGKKGISAFLVERGTKGFRAGKKEDKLGVRSSDTSELIFEDCRIPEGNLLGREGHGFTKVAAARLLVFRAAALRDCGREHTTESSMAKLFASETAVEVANEAIQIHGGYGYVKEYPVERHWRDSKLGTIGEGTSEVQRLVIARELLGLRGMVR
jgi:alkylation response protein AidB-like acyl-CoA dehydrogenase